MSKQQIRILQQMARDGVDPKKPFEFINGKFVQLTENETTSSETTSTLDESTEEKVDLSVDAVDFQSSEDISAEEKTTEVASKKKKPVKPKQKQEK